MASHVASPSIIMSLDILQDGMISDDVQRVELEARKRSLEEYKLRCQDLRSENSSLKAEKDQQETDALQVVAMPGVGWTMRAEGPFTYWIFVHLRMAILCFRLFLS